MRRRTRAALVASAAGAALVGCSALLGVSDVDYADAGFPDSSGEGAPGGDASRDVSASDAARAPDAPPDAGAPGADAAIADAACVAPDAFGCGPAPCCGSLACDEYGRCVTSCSTADGGCNFGVLGCCMGFHCVDSADYCCIDKGGSCVGFTNYCCGGLVCIDGLCR